MAKNNKNYFSKQYNKNLKNAFSINNNIFRNTNRLSFDWIIWPTKVIEWITNRFIIDWNRQPTNRV